jgi:alpha-tubulin suppressor-like RCC1 family protein
MKRLLLFVPLAACGPSYQPTELPWRAHAMTAAGAHTLILTDADETANLDAGTVESYGEDVPLPNDPSSGEPMMLTLPTATAIAVGVRHACIVSTGQVTCWGDNSAGELGAHRACDSDGCVLAPGVMPTLPAVRALAAGDDFTCAITMEDMVMCWGANGAGELGGSSVPALDPPTPIMLPDGKPLFAERVIAVDSTACAIDHTGSAWCWGEGYGVPQRLALSAVTDIAVGSDHGCAIASGGLTCWGDNINGQIDASSAAGCASPCTLPPTPIALAATRVVVGDRHTCALDASGDVTCWGSNEYGQLGESDAFLVGAPNVAFRGATDLVAGTTHTCALAADDHAWCWGDL